MNKKNDKKPFFIRQNIKLSYVPQPSNDPSKLRLKFLEVPYRLYYKMNKLHRLTLASLVTAAAIPFIIYNSICFFLRFEQRAKLRATLGDDNNKVLKEMEKFQIK